MKFSKRIRTVYFALCLMVAAGFPALCLADAYEEALEALAEGEYRTASRDFKRLARQDHPRAQYQLGMLYLFGKGVAQDVDQGIEWLKRAAENGSYLAANELGQVYLAGRGVAPDEQEAMKWLERATRLAGEHPEEAEEGCD
jgi:TPR repeat protein